MSEQIYKALLLDHYRSPRNVDTLENATAVGEGFNANCGDKIRLGVLINNGHIEQVKFQIRACAICTASASLMSELLTDTSVDSARAHIQNVIRAVTSEEPWPAGTEALSGAAASINRHKCITLSWQACEDALTAAETIQSS